MERKVELREFNTVAPDRAVPLMKDDDDHPAITCIAAITPIAEIGMMIHWFEEVQRPRERT
ncbi:MAG: hypothetical protein ABW047_05600 [Nitrospiraceae bacterium]